MKTCCFTVCFTLGLSSLLQGANGFMLPEGVLPDHLLDTIPKDMRRFPRSVEGTPCTTTVGQSSIYSTGSPPVSVQVPNGVDSCLFNGLPNTKCNPTTGRCECDPAVAVRLSIFPNASICLPLAYVNNTKGRCLPSFPDMCATLVSGSYCASVQSTTSNTRQLQCLCQSGTGTWPNCMARLGSPCQNSTVCQLQIPNSYCANVVNGYGTCQCPTRGTSVTVFSTTGTSLGTGIPPTTTTIQAQTTVPNLSQNQCVPVYCPSSPLLTGEIQPCQGDNSFPASQLTDSPFTCVNGSRGFQCNCNTGSKGRAHNATVVGRCCKNDRLACSDYSKCITLQNLCDGVADCNDCSDEKFAFCSGARPNSPACGFPNRITSPGDDFYHTKMNFIDQGGSQKPVAAFDSIFDAFKMPSRK